MFGANDAFCEALENALSDVFMFCVFLGLLAINHTQYLSKVMLTTPSVEFLRNT